MSDKKTGNLAEDTVVFDRIAYTVMGLVGVGLVIYAISAHNQIPDGNAWVPAVAGLIVIAMCIYNWLFPRG